MEVAYYDTAIITAVKSFIVKAAGSGAKTCENPKINWTVF
jgi:hypothetical protein